MKLNPVSQDIRIGIAIRYDENFLKYLSKIAEFDFETISIIFNENIASVDLKGLAKQTQKILSEKEIKVSTLVLHANPLVSKDAVQWWQNLIDSAELFDTRVVGGYTGRITNKPIEKSIPKFKEVFSDLAERAGQLGIRIAFDCDPANGDWRSGDWNIALNPAAWEEMFVSLPFKNIGLQWNPAYQMICFADPLMQVRKWGVRIFNVVGKDATIYHEIIQKYGIGCNKQYANIRTPGFGDTDWRKIISEFRKIGYSGSIDIEGWHDPVYRGDLEMTGLMASIRYLQECRGGAYVPNISIDDDTQM